MMMMMMIRAYTVQSYDATTAQLAILLRMMGVAWHDMGHCTLHARGTAARAEEGWAKAPGRDQTKKSRTIYI